jgi:death-on-curing protein
MKWLDARDLRVIHANLIAEHGGLASAARKGALDAALLATQAAFASMPGLDTTAIAANYAWTFARSQVFADGNLRLALAASFLFLAINGKRVTADPCDAVSLIRDAQKGAVSFAEFSGWFDRNVAPLPRASTAADEAQNARRHS